MLIMLSFQTGLDVQGFEVILESVFGPAGFFPNNMMQSMFRGADEMIMSRVRNASLPLNWLASVMDIIMSNTPLKDLQAAGSQAIADTKNSASNLPKSLTQKVPVPEPEPLVSEKNVTVFSGSLLLYVKMYFDEWYSAK